jgi:hypothetical protein
VVFTRRLEGRTVLRRTMRFRVLGLGEKQGLHQAADILEKYAIGSATEMSELEKKGKMISVNWRTEDGKLFRFAY